MPKIRYRHKLSHASRLCLCVAAFGLPVGTGSTASAQGLPSDPQQTCVVPGSTFKTWFKTQSVQPDGVVEPPNSVTFPHQNNCQFYQWSEQMFLWLASPAPPEYGGGDGRIYASPVFFGVLPKSDGHRSFRPNDPSGSSGPFGKEAIGIRTLQNGPGGHPLVFTKSGELAEVEPTPPGAKPEILDSAGAKVLVAHATRLNSGALVLKSEADAVIQARPRPLADALAVRTRHTIQKVKVREFLVDGNPIFIDANGNVVDVEVGQAGFTNFVLQAQNKSLVYYTISTNDVYAYFRTGVANKKIDTKNQFPTTDAQLKEIIAYAKTRGVSFPDATALTVEIKTSWVEASGLPNPQTYMTMKATVPTYDMSNPAKWTVIPGKDHTVLLAMVGMHVVGSVANHPELVWATFEHVANDPRGAYQYVNSKGATVTVPQQSGGPWTFAPKDAVGPFNQPHMKVAGADIVAVPLQGLQTIETQPKISPSDTIHWKAFGAGYDTSPNPEDKTPAASNTEIISINNSVRSQLVGGDVRGNYILTGATWTDGGAAPDDTNQIGTSMLQNSTMETYHQGASPSDLGLNCFVCHANTKTKGTLATTEISHIFSALNPLP